MLQNAASLPRLPRNQGDGIIDGIPKERNALRTGQNSGYQALCLGVMSTAPRHILLGYDFKYLGGKSHWHGGHPAPSPESSYPAWTKYFNTLKAQLPAGVEVLQASSPESYLRCFPFVKLEDVL